MSYVEGRDFLQIPSSFFGHISRSSHDFVFDFDKTFIVGQFFFKSEMNMKDPVNFSVYSGEF